MNNKTLKTTFLISLAITVIALIVAYILYAINPDIISDNKEMVDSLITKQSQTIKQAKDSISKFSEEVDSVKKENSKSIAHASDIRKKVKNSNRKLSKLERSIKEESTISEKDTLYQRVYKEVLNEI